MIGEVTGRGPDLLPVEHPLVAVEFGPQSDVAEIGAGVRLGVPLTPCVVTGEQTGQEVLLLLVGAPHEERVAEHLDAECVVRPTGRDARPRELLGEDDLLGGAQAATAVLDRPAGSQEVRFVEGVAPRSDEFGEPVAPECSGALPVRRELLGEERLDLLAIGLGVCAVGRLHADEPNER